MPRLVFSCAISPMYKLRVSHMIFPHLFTLLHTIMSLKEKFNSKFRIGKTEEPTNFVFDENSFDMKVEGGPTQSKPIKITAVLNVGEMKGKPLDLDCKWFSKTNSDIREIVGITGQTYQPCLSDVGTMYNG